MAPRHPFLHDVHEAHRTIEHLNERHFHVDPACGRQFFGNIPCAQKTGRTSWVDSVFSAPKWMRSLIAPSSGHVVLSMDFKAEEFGLAAHLSGDRAMLAVYDTEDPHMAFAIRAGAAPAGARGDDPRYAAVRKKYKCVNLGVNYGQTPYGIAQQTGLHPREATRLYAQHRRLFPDYWAWTARYTRDAFAKGRCFTVAGWPREVTRLDNARSVSNSVIQGTAADLMRLAVVYLTRNRTPLVAVVHDGFVFEVPLGEKDATIEVIDTSLRQAVERLLPGSRLRWTHDEYADRYRDKDGGKMWRLAESVLGVLPDATGTGGVRQHTVAERHMGVAERHIRPLTS
jgi:DNA polymerase-1